MNSETNMAFIASVVSQPSRAAIVTALLDGRYHPASECAIVAGVKPQTASHHLQKMVDAHILKKEKHGRHHYYCLLNYEVAEILETLLSLSTPSEVRSLKQSSLQKRLQAARTCYDHLAGELGVQMIDALVQIGALERKEADFNVTDKGEEFFSTFGISLSTCHEKRRSFSRVCLDWTERKHHLAGSLGQALLERLMDLEWLERVATSREMKVTPKGKEGFKEIFSIEIGAK